MWDYRKTNYTPTKLNYDTALTSQSPNFLQRILLRPHLVRLQGKVEGHLKENVKKRFIVYSPVDIILYLKRRKYDLQ